MTVLAGYDVALQISALKLARQIQEGLGYSAPFEIPVAYKALAVAGSLIVKGVFVNLSGDNDISVRLHFEESSLGIGVKGVCPLAGDITVTADDRTSRRILRSTDAGFGSRPAGKSHGDPLHGGVGATAGTAWHPERCAI